MTVFGWDASDYDWDRGPMDLQAAHTAGIRFFTHKATEGTRTVHEKFGKALTRARAAGIPVLGAYHVVRTAPSIDDQVQHLLATVNAAAPWWKTWSHWLWQVDLEKWPYDKVSAKKGSDFAKALAAKTGKRVVLYASRGQYGDSLPGGVALWNAHYPSSRAAGFKALYPGDGGVGWTRYSGQVARIWQYSSKARIGSQPTCDANAWRGSLAELLTFVNAAAPAPAPTPKPTPRPVKHKEGSRTLRLGMVGEDVEFVQDWIGPEEAGPDDGKFGPRTEDGVRWYQDMRGIKVDGVVGPKTWREMGVTYTG